jgi:hypothetical protein
LSKADRWPTNGRDIGKRWVMANLDALGHRRDITEVKGPTI